MKILISGAGIGGCTLAWWLAKAGHQVTVVERQQAQRSSGAPVDIQGPAIDVIEQMGLLPRMREAATRIEGMRFVDGSGRTAARVPTAQVARARGKRDVELPRGELAKVLETAAMEHANVVFAEHVVKLEQDSEGVDVTFASGLGERFELVVGADGLHSAVRKLAFGDESQFVAHQGLYVATLPLQGDEGRDVVMFNAPGRSLTIHPSRSKPMAAFIFWAPQATFDVRDEREQRAFLERTFVGDGWRVPEVLSKLSDTSELYFDSVSRVRLPTWTKGRVTLLGDAASCVSLFGGGSSLAIRGAHQLAKALAGQPLAQALAHYEREHRRATDPNAKGMSFVASMLIPKSSIGISTRNALLHLWPVVAAAGRVGRLFQRGVPATA